MNDLQDFRNKIDEIDDGIVKLLLARFAVVKNVAEYKKKHGLEIEQKKRETEVLKKIADKTDNQEYKQYILDIYQTILDTSKKSQQKI